MAVQFERDARIRTIEAEPSFVLASVEFDRSGASPSVGGHVECDIEIVPDAARFTSAELDLTVTATIESRGIQRSVTSDRSRVEFRSTTVDPGFTNGIQLSLECTDLAESFLVVEDDPVWERIRDFDPEFAIIELEYDHERTKSVLDCSDDLIETNRQEYREWISTLSDG